MPRRTASKRNKDTVTDTTSAPSGWARVPTTMKLVDGNTGDDVDWNAFLGTQEDAPSTNSNSRQQSSTSRQLDSRPSSSKKLNKKKKSRPFVGQPKFAKFASTSDSSSITLGAVHVPKMKKNSPKYPHIHTDTDTIYTDSSNSRQNQSPSHIASNLNALSKALSPYPAPLREHIDDIDDIGDEDEFLSADVHTSRQRSGSVSSDDNHTEEPQEKSRQSSRSSDAEEIDIDADADTAVSLEEHADESDGAATDIASQHVSRQISASLSSHSEDRHVSTDIADDNSNSPTNNASESDGAHLISDDDDAGDNNMREESDVQAISDDDDDGARELSDNEDGTSSSSEDDARDVLQDLPSPFNEPMTPESEGYESSFVDEGEYNDNYENEDDDWTPPYDHDEENASSEDASEDRNELRREAAELQRMTRRMRKQQQPRTHEYEERAAFRNAFMEISDDDEVEVVATTRRNHDNNVREEYETYSSDSSSPTAKDRSEEEEGAEENENDNDNSAEESNGSQSQENETYLEDQDNNSLYKQESIEIEDEPQLASSSSSSEEEEEQVDAGLYNHDDDNINSNDAPVQYNKSNTESKTSAEISEDVVFHVKSPGKKKKKRKQRTSTASRNGSSAVTIILDDNDDDEEAAIVDVDAADEYGGKSGKKKREKKRGAGKTPSKKSSLSGWKRVEGDMDSDEEDALIEREADELRAQKKKREKKQGIATGAVASSSSSSSSSGWIRIGDDMDMDDDDSGIEDVTEKLSQVSIDIDTRMPEWLASLKEVRTPEVAERLLDHLNVAVLGGILSGYVSVKWNKRLLTTAGTCTLRTNANTRNREALIELSTKVVDEPLRLYSTLAHEMAHACAWIIDNTARPPHGKTFKKWSRMFMKYDPGLNIKTCHNYTVNFKFNYYCSLCDATWGRHSKSIDTNKKRCACGGVVRLKTVEKKKKKNNNKN